MQISILQEIRFCGISFFMLMILNLLLNNENASPIVVTSTDFPVNGFLTRYYMHTQRRNELISGIHGVRSAEISPSRRSPIQR